MRRDYHIAGLDGLRMVREPDALLGEAIQHGLIVCELAEHCDGSLPDGFFGEGNRIAHAKAHSKVLSSDDFHSLGE